MQYDTFTRYWIWNIQTLFYVKHSHAIQYGTFPRYSIWNIHTLFNMKYSHAIQCETFTRYSIWNSWVTDVLSCCLLHHCRGSCREKKMHIHILKLSYRNFMLHRDGVQTPAYFKIIRRCWYRFRAFRPFSFSKNIKVAAWHRQPLYWKSRWGGWRIYHIRSPKENWC